MNPNTLGDETGKNPSPLDSPPRISAKKQANKKDWENIRENVRLIVELAALIGLVFYVFETKRTNNLTQQSLRITQSQFRKERRGDSGRCRSVFRGMPITRSGMMAIMTPG
jgi:hypothetical protein